MNLNGDHEYRDNEFSSDATLDEMFAAGDDTTGDVTLSNDEDAMDVLRDRESCIVDLIDHVGEVGGVNKHIALEMERLEPGIITNKRMVESYSEDYTKTNYKETVASLEDLHVAVKLAIAFGVAALVGKIVSWLWKQFFSDDAEGAGGGKDKGKNRDKKISETAAASVEVDEVLKETTDIFRKNEAALKDALIDRLGDDAKGKAFSQAYNQKVKGLYQQAVAKTYTPYIHGVVQNKGDHFKLLNELIGGLPAWTKELRELQHKLIELGKPESKEEIKADEFYVKVQFGGNKGEVVAVKLKETLDNYAKICVQDEEWFSKIEVSPPKMLAAAKFYGDLFDKIDEAQKLLWESIGKDMEKYKGDLPKQKDVPDERRKMLEIAWGRLKPGYQNLVNIYRIVNHCQQNTEKFAKSLEAGTMAQLKFIDSMLKSAESKVEGDDKSAIATARAKIAELLSKFGSAVGGLFGGKKKEGDGKPATEPTKTEPAKPEGSNPAPTSNKA